MLRQGATDLLSGRKGEVIDLVLLDGLASGSFGKVFRCEMQVRQVENYGKCLFRTEIVAVKRARKDDELRAASLRTEAKILKVWSL